MIVLRHPPPLEPGLCAGRYEIPVDDRHPRLALLLTKLHALRVSRVVSSPALRCKNLALDIAASVGRPFEIDGRIQELDFGQWEGKRWSDIMATDRARFDQWSNNWLALAPPGGESVAALERRVDEFAFDYCCESVLVVTHAGVIRALRVILQSYSWEQAMATTVPYLEPMKITGAS